MWRYIQTFFRIRTPPQLQRAALEPLFLHPALPKERAVGLLKAHYTQNEQHPDRKSLPHVVMMRVAGGGADEIDIFFIDPHFAGPHNTKGAVLSKRTTLVRACCRFMPAVIVPACTTPSSMVSESHVVSIEPEKAPTPSPPTSSASDPDQEGENKKEEEDTSSPPPAATAASVVTPVAAVPSRAVSRAPSRAASRAPSRAASRARPSRAASGAPSRAASRAPSRAASRAPVAAPPSVLGVPVPSEVGSVPGITWPSQPGTDTSSAVHPAPPPTALSPPPLELQSAPGTVFT